MKHKIWDSYSKKYNSPFISNQYHTFCQKYFNDILGDRVVLGDEPLKSSQIKKPKFADTKNDHLELEPFVDCLCCLAGWFCLRQFLTKEKRINSMQNA